jgi:MYXO-CTERM domain-containing protein
MKKALIAAMGLSGLCGMASADVVITEIFYNLNGSESGATEWVEIYNNGSLAIDMSGWVYGDSQDGVFAGAFAAGTVLGAGEVAVLCFQPEAVFQSIWGAGVRVIQLDTEVSLANSASASNETVALFDASNTLVDEVNFEVSTNGWPGSANGVSISLNADALDASLNDLGASWSITQIGVNGGREALIINPDIANATALDISSAGVVPAPGALALVGLGGLVAGRRRRA